MIVSLLITILGILFALTGFGYDFYDDGRFLVKSENELSRSFNADMDFLYFSGLSMALVLEIILRC